MTEHFVQQRSPEWFELRAKLSLTASSFGDAIGLGRGKPYDFLKYMIEEREKDETSNEFTRHGVLTEPIIFEAYQLLTGSKLRDTGFWTCTDENNPLCSMIGASPDAVITSTTNELKPEALTSGRQAVSSSVDVGITEFKAPVIQMYAADNPSATQHGIPRAYMVQMQGQMAVCGFVFCDFMAVCMKTREIQLKRVHWQPLYWKALVPRLKRFCHIVEEARQRQQMVLPALDFTEARMLSQEPPIRGPTPAESTIRVEDLLNWDSTNNLYAMKPNRPALSFGFLTGKQHDIPNHLTVYAEHLLHKLDNEIDTHSRIDNEIDTHSPCIELELH